MIVTLTPNPSIDRSLELAGPLERGGVSRSVRSHDDVGGKGVNVANVVRLAGELAVAVLPGDHDDPLVRGLRDLRLTHRTVPLDASCRVNITLAEPDGTTTKINAPGPELSIASQDKLAAVLAREGAGAAWAALCGSLPPGVPADFYAQVAERIHGPRIAVDTSGTALRAAIDRAADKIDLIKPNAEELAELLDVDQRAFEGDPALALKTAWPLITRGVTEILLTLGENGALLLTADGAWKCEAPRVQVHSTVGAGDSSLAGYLIASLRGEDPAGRLALAVAYGSAAASLPGSQMPTPQDLPPLPAVRKAA
jgi:1-phosphofructokinase